MSTAKGSRASGGGPQAPKTGRGARPGSGLTKKGKPRAGTGGKGKRALEGKGPTPPAELRPGHPAQRRAASGAAKGATQRSSAQRSSGGAARFAAPGDDTRRGPQAGQARRGLGTEVHATRGAGDAPEFVAGRNSVVESMRAGIPAMVLYVGRGQQQDDRVTEAVKLAAQAGVAVLEASQAELDRHTGGALHQGLALRVRPYEYAHPDDLIASAERAGQLPLIVALDSVTDPRNLGAIVRSAAAFGAHGVVVPSRRGAGVTAGAWKASAGALARLPVARAANLSRTLHAYRDAGVFVAGLDAAGETGVRDLELATAPLVLVVGSEGKGLSRIVAQACDMLVRIPIAAQTESLNAGMAASIALYEVATIRSRLP